MGSMLRQAWIALDRLLRAATGFTAGQTTGFFVPVAPSGLDFVWFGTWGFAFGSTPGYIPSAASRLHRLAASPLVTRRESWNLRK